jgi:hypothetical protein
MNPKETAIEHGEMLKELRAQLTKAQEAKQKAEAEVERLRNGITNLLNWCRMFSGPQGNQPMNSIVSAEDFKIKLGCAVCGHIACVCVIQDRHKANCRFRISATCPVGIECDHGYDVCPICDPCDCGASQNEKGSK